MRPLIQLKALSTEFKSRRSGRLEREGIRLGGLGEVLALMDGGAGRRMVRVMTRLSRSCPSV